MNEVRISDVTMKQAGKSADFTLSFKEKLELAKLLDRLGVSVIELEGIEQTKIDSLRIKSVAAAVKNSIIAVPVELSRESVETTWNALKEARRPRLRSLLLSVRCRWSISLTKSPPPCWRPSRRRSGPVGKWWTM